MPGSAHTSRLWCFAVGLSSSSDRLLGGADLRCDCEKRELRLSAKVVPSAWVERRVHACGCLLYVLCGVVGPPSVRRLASDELQLTYACEDR